ncbi:DNA adenine methylase [Liquorilactobacillus satsumensis]|uniref:DNA adenine methylase n=1 Tax=Liquorilactobacillus satsumensis TaxID=259059 RepID=UPI00345CD808
MILENYLKKNNSNLRQVHLVSGIPETTVRNINKRDLDKWNIEYFDAVAKTIGKSKFTVMKELENLAATKDKENFEITNLNGKYSLENRRYIGNKNKLLNWIENLIEAHTIGNSFFDVFAGTGVVTKKMLPKYDRFILNDFLFSNNVIFKAFFGTEHYGSKKIINYCKKFQAIETNTTDNDYFVNNYGNKFFSNHDARIIGEIRAIIHYSYNLNEREKSILIASLIYSADKVANTVGHYDAYRKKIKIQDRFKFELINPLDVSGKKIEIYRKDSNELIRSVTADIAFIDPPYNSRQYSRFYHVLEEITKWDKPQLEGVAMKPPVENMSAYSKKCAPKVFDDLIKNLNAKYIVVTYSNTYKSKSNSSKNKITHEQILESLNSIGNTQKFEIPFKFFNAGKTDLKDHKEFVFITEVRK